jgi:hypothetical protein
MAYRFVIPKTPGFFRLVDFAMKPIMFVLGGFNRNSLQETHPWHLYRNIDEKNIDLSLVYTHQGDDSSLIQKHALFLFHSPIFGGWKKYIVLEPSTSERPFYIGWTIQTKNTRKTEVHKLPIYENSIRVLSGSPLFSGYFFALSAEGEQVPIKCIGQGRLGDGQYSDVRLY